MDLSFETIVDTHHAEIYRYLHRVLRPRAEADGLVQETFLRAFRVHRSRPAGADVRAWLFAIATSLCRHHGHARRRQRAAEPAGTPTPRAADGSRLDDEAMLREGRTPLEDVIGRLPITQRLAFAMRKLHDLDYDAIATSLGCSAERARTHVFLAMRALRRALDGVAPGTGTRGRQTTLFR